MAHSTHDCAPTLTDSQVLEFCKYGHLMLEGVVAEEINARCRRWLDDHPAGDGPAEANQWHIDGGSRFGPELDVLKWFYYPADYTSTAPRFGEQVRGAHDNARMFLWLCGRAEEFQPAAGPSWPQSTPGNRARYGAPGDRPRR